MMTIASNLSAIHDRIAHAAQRAGRSTDAIALMAVTKTFPVALILKAYEAGQRLFGENRVQEFAEKVGGLTELRDAEFHMIGHLQSNKAAKAAEIFHAIDSLDSAKLAQRLDAAAGNLGKTLDVLIEINLGERSSQERGASGFDRTRKHFHWRSRLDAPAHSRSDDRASLYRGSGRRKAILWPAPRVAGPAGGAKLPSRRL